MKTIICELGMDISVFGRTDYPIRISYNTSEDVNENEIYTGSFIPSTSKNPYIYMKIIKVLENSYKYIDGRTGELSNEIKNINFKEIDEFKTGKHSNKTISFGNKI